MQIFMIIVIVAVCSMSYLSDPTMRILPQPFKFVPELMTAAIALPVLLMGLKQNFAQVKTKYWLAFGMTALVIVCGAIANNVGTGPALAGMRYLLRAVPFFFLPLVYTFSEKQLKQQLGLLAIIAIIQLPIAAYQRLTQLQQTMNTGDYVFGTLMLSSTLTFFLIGAMCIALAFTLRGRMPKWQFAIFFLICVIPMSINETKITVFILPLCLLTVALLATPRGKRLKMTGVALMLLVAAGAIFVPLYDYLGKQNVRSADAYSISDMFTKPDYFEKYLDHDTDVGTDKEVGRTESVTIPWKIATSDPIRFAFGYGIGNASLSTLGSAFTGEQGQTLWMYSSITSWGNFVLEIGMFGFICAVVLHMLVLGDALKVGFNDPGFHGGLAVGWVAIVVMMTLMMFYFPAYLFESMSYLFWYFSGVIAARAAHLTRVPAPAARPVRFHSRPTVA